VSDHCTESAYIHPVGDPDTKLTSREEIVARRPIKRLRLSTRDSKDDE
jgi:hypothetical protein